MSSFQLIVFFKLIVLLSSFHGFHLDDFFLFLDLLSVFVFNYLITWFPLFSLESSLVVLPSFILALRTVNNIRQSYSKNGDCARDALMSLLFLRLLVICFSYSWLLPPFHFSLGVLDGGLYEIHLCPIAVPTFFNLQLIAFYPIFISPVSSIFRLRLLNSVGRFFSFSLKLA